MADAHLHAHRAAITLVSYGGKQSLHPSDFCRQQQFGHGCILDIVRYGSVGYLMQFAM